MVTPEVERDFVRFGFHCLDATSQDKTIMTLDSLSDGGKSVPLSDADFPYGVNLVSKLLEVLDLTYSRSRAFPEIENDHPYWIEVTCYSHWRVIAHLNDTHALVDMNYLSPERTNNLIALLKQIVTSWELPFEVSW